MTVYNFGVGNMVGRRTDVSNPTPVRFGTLAEVQVDMDRTLKQLMGQYQMPVDIAAAELKISAKAKFASIVARAYNDLFLGQTLTTGAGELTAFDEAHSVPGSISYTVQVTNHSTFLHDLGVAYASDGTALVRVAASSEALGKYSVDETTGTYTFASADASAALLFSYSYTVSNMIQIDMSQQLMGASPSFELHLQEAYTTTAGVAGMLNLTFYACKAGKLSMPFKNQDYTINDFDMQMYANQAGNIGRLSFTK